MCRRKSSAFLTALPVLLATPALAAPTTFTWNGGSGDFSSANWTKGGDLADTSTIPDDNDDALVFNTSGAQTITFTANALAGGLDTVPAISIGNSADLTFNLAGKTLDALPPGNNRGSPGARNSILVSASSLTVTSSAAGGKIQNFNGSTAGSGTLLTVIGNGSTTSHLTLNTSGGFGATWANDGNVQFQGNGSTLTVTGSGSILTIARGGLVTSAPTAGSNQVTVSAGGVINSSGTTFGTNSPSNSGTSTITITGATSAFNHTSATGGLFLGRAGTTVVNIAAGGLLNQTGTGSAIMSDVNGTSTVNLTGSGSTLSLASIFMGGGSSAASGSGTINVGSGTIARAHNAAGTGIKVWDKGLLNLTGGTVEIASGKNLELVDSSTVAALAGRGTLRGTGTIQRYGASGTAFMTLQNTSGDVRPGDISATPATGLLTLNNANFNHAAGGFLHLNVTTPSAYDQMRFIDTDNLAGTTTAMLGGTLQYTLDAGFTPPSNGFLDFVLAEDVIYNPAADNLATLLDGAGYAGDYTYGVQTVGAADYAGQFGGYEVLRLEFSTIPEPSAALVLIGVGSLYLSRRRR